MDILTFSLFWVFGWLTIILVAWHLRGLRRQRLLELAHKERMLALEKGVPLAELPEDGGARPGPAEVMASLRINPRWPLGLGGLAVMVGVGVSLALALSGEAEHNRVWSFGLIFVFLGLGLMLHYALTRPARG
jgi:hypothetical protein